jgi:hypothetical protein
VAFYPKEAGPIGDDVLLMDGLQAGAPGSAR